VLKEPSFCNHLPMKCQECAKSSERFIIHGRCSLCQDLSFQAEVLCYLNRSTQNSSAFEFHAFQPLLKLTVSSGQQTRPKPKAQPAEIILDKLFDSDKLKYERALALQKLAGDPEDVMLEIKHHFA